MNSTARAVVIGCASVLLGACATATITPPERSYAGRFAVTATRDAEMQNLSGRFSLEIRGDQQILDLSTPVGTTVARIEVGPDRARASGPQLSEVEGNDPDALVERLLGWRLPVGGLGDWIEGRPNPKRPSKVETENGLTAIIKQDGWTIRIGERFEPGQNPKRLTLDRPASGMEPAVTLRLIVDDPAS